MQQTDLQPPTKKQNKVKNLLALASGYFVDQGENQAMSIFSPVLRQLWGLSFSNLSLITFIRSLLQALSSPFWGYLADKYSRKKVLFWGTGFWGIWTIAVGLTQSFSQLLVVRVISGIGLGCLMPATFSIMADSFAPKIRGRMLGYLEAIGVLGIIIFTVGLGQLATPELWRWGFIILGAASIISGIIILIFVDEPIRGQSEPEMKGKLTFEQAERFKVNFSDLRKVLEIPTIRIAILQGLAGSMPWVIMGAFLILWLASAAGFWHNADRDSIEQRFRRLYWRFGRTEEPQVWAHFYRSNLGNFWHTTDCHPADRIQ